jgi:beta-mannanase
VTWRERVAWLRRTRRARFEYYVSALLVAIIFGLLALQFLGPWSSEPVRPSARPWPVSPAGAVAIGVTTAALAANSYAAWTPADLAEVNAFEQHARLHADIVMWFADWEHSGFNPVQARAVAGRGSVPEISWEPWDSTLAPREDQPRYTLRSIIDGDHDAYVRRFAAAVAAYGRPLRLRFAQEMNGDAYPWAESQNGNAQGEFAKAWRHVHRIFARAGATDVIWIWSPVAGAIHRGEYPGRDYVDVVGLSGFNGGTTLFSKQWRSFSDAFATPLAELARIAPDKPVALTEIASTETGGDKAIWIRDLFADVRERPSIEALTWFNLRKETDWRIESSPEAEAAFAAGAASLRGLSR